MIKFEVTNITNFHQYVSLLAFEKYCTFPLPTAPSSEIEERVNTVNSYYQTIKLEVFTTVEYNPISVNFLVKYEKCLSKDVLFYYYEL